MVKKGIDEKTKTLVKDDRIVDHPKGQGFVKRSGKVNNILTNRKGLINGPISSLQDNSSNSKGTKNKKSKKSVLGAILKK